MANAPAPAPGTIEFTPVGWDELAVKLEGHREEILRTMRVAFQRMEQHMVPALKEYTPKAVTHDLRNKTVANILGQAEDMRMEIRQSAFEKNYPYGVGVRMGTKPHWPPYKALVPWVSLRWGVSGQDANRAAFFLARKISKYGTQPNDYHVRCLDANKAELVEIMQEEVDNAVARLEQKAE